MRAAATLVGVILAFAVTTASAADAKPYTEGQVTEVSFIKIKPGKFEAYMQYLDTTYKQIMEASKKAGLIVDYAVFSATARTPQDADLILTVVYANMAALDKSAEADAVAEKIAGSMEAQSKAAIDRESMREVLGSQLIRELKLK
jgi:L-rhamnose mutarotase